MIFKRKFFFDFNRRDAISNKFKGSYEEVKDEINQHKVEIAKLRVSNKRKW